MKNLGFKLLLLCVMSIITLGASAEIDRNYLCFTANTNGSTVELVKNGNANNVIMQYSTDEGETWATIDFETETTTGTITLEKANDKVYFRNTSQASEVSGFSKDYKDGYNYYQFVMSGSIAASGNVMSLVDSEVETTTIPNDYCFAYLFKDCKALVSAPELPATTLRNKCYYFMFSGCSNLTKAPALPAKDLVGYCYESMFNMCTSLKEAPELPATDLKTYCYFRMFERCENLKSAPVLHSMNLAGACYCQMFSGCTNLVFAPALPATTLAEDCYEEMFLGCTNLTEAPELNAMDLAYGCYDGMFEECTSLEIAPTLPATSLKGYCYYQMFRGCTNLKSAPALPATTLASGCYSYMFYDCESLTEAPELPAAELCYECYRYMFYYCNNLKSIKVGFTSWNNDATYYWLYDTAEGGVFICPDELPMYYDWDYGIPCDWTRAYEVKANNEPNTENYYATFYSKENAYQVPNGVTAYTGAVDGSVLKLTAIKDGIIPADEAVILKATQSQVYLPYTTATGNKSDGNKLSGTDEETTLDASDYALSLGQNGVGFYLWEGKSIDAHKAYLTLPSSAGAKAFTFEFDDGPTGIESLTPALSEGEGFIYNLNGVRVDENYKGVVIKNGKKYVVK